VEPSAGVEPVDPRVYFPTAELRGHVEIAILAIQARVLCAVGIGWMAFGLWMGFDPWTVLWRAAVASVIAMVVTGKLLRVVVDQVNDRIGQEIADQEAAVVSAVAAPAVVAPAAARRRQ
jgi:hypothetical protein